MEAKLDILNRMIALQVRKDLEAALKKLKLPADQLVLEHPTRFEHGDFSTNIAMILVSRRNNEAASPLELAQKITNAYRSLGLPDYIAEIKVEKPGFINIWLKNSTLIAEARRALREKATYGSANLLAVKKILLEHTSPNPQTTIMLGHLRNNFLGMSCANILSFLGAKVTRDCLVNDRGTHLCRSIWGYLVFGQKKVGLKKDELLKFRQITQDRLGGAIRGNNWQQLLSKWEQSKASWWQPKDFGFKSDHANLIWYVLGSRAYRYSKKVQEQVGKILIAWEADDPTVKDIWRQLLAWSEKGYQQTYERIGNHHDYVWHESEYYRRGKDIVQQGLKKSVFRRSQGAIVTDLAKQGLPDTVVAKKDGTALYLTADLALVKLKIRKFPSDLYVWDVGVEQSLYFRQLFAVCEQLGIAKRDKLFHLSYALINFKGERKMSTRQGNVVVADKVLDDLHQKALNIIKRSNQKLRGKISPKKLAELAEKVALGGIKYSLLKYGRQTTIQFDPDESLALKGDSGPYLQYTYARCCSVLNRAKKTGLKANESMNDELSLSNEETNILRQLYKFPEVVAEAGEKYAPNLVCNFLYELAQAYNLFYNQQAILNAESEELEEFRLALTVAVAQVIENGLSLLGIETMERM